MKNIGKLMQQAQEMQGKLQEMQEQLAEISCTGQAGGGMVKVTLSGKNEAQAVEIDESLFQQQDKTVIEDLVVAAINDARSQVDQRVQEEQQKLMGGMELPPGMNFPGM